MQRETVGKLSSELLAKRTESQSVIDLQREMQQDYLKHLEEAIATGKKQFDDDFYVVIITKKERLMQNVLRNYFSVRKSCPTPDWDQTVYHVIRNSDELVYLWTLPAKDVCEYIKRNALYIVNEELELLKFVMAFENGDLLRYSKMKNGEKFDSPLLET